MRVLVVAAHPDDEVLGVGGTIARHVAQGDEVRILLVAEGITSRDDVRDPATRKVDLESLRGGADEAAAILGAHPPELLGLPDNRLDTLPLLELVKKVETVVARVTPALVYTHHSGDLNVDHRLVHQAVITSCRPVPGSPVRGIYAFETPSSTEWASRGSAAPFAPSRFVDISQYLALKTRALACYASEMRAFPHARSLEGVEALARTRGVHVGLAAAEAFETVREVVV